MPRFTHMSLPALVLFSLLIAGYGTASTPSLNNTRVPGYRGIWFELGQKYEAGDKYSGALGTYTAKHRPLAIYSPVVQKTFFVYGGTPSETQRHLLCMIGEYNHQTGTVSQPVVVHDKLGVDDPHDNPALLIDGDGFLWVFISGRSQGRPGFKYRSRDPYSITSFIRISEEEMTYPQPWITEFGFFHFFTKYTGIRQLYFETSPDGINWTEDRLLSAITVDHDHRSGHYQLSDVFAGKTVGTFFNRHPFGRVDRRTDLYYIQSSDFGKQWTTIDGTPLKIPLTAQENPSRVLDYASQSRNVYLKDMSFDPNGSPACLFIRSLGHEPGPRSAPYEWCVTFRKKGEWHTSVVTVSDHNYDMGSLYLTETKWHIVAPTEPGPQAWGVGGELAIWTSEDQGNTWRKTRELTHSSEFSHSYVRRPVHYRTPFCFFWASGHSHEFSRSDLYFGDFEGNVWRLPYTMDLPQEAPLRVDTP